MAVLRNRRRPRMHPLRTNPLLGEGPSPRGAPSVPPFSGVFPEKQHELKSLKRQTKAVEEEMPRPFLLSLRLSLKAL
jgi:hypothetical protein